MWTKVAFVFLLPLVFSASTAFAQSPAPNSGGTVCPAGTSVQAAEAAGCRFIGSETGYDICANMGTENLPQCYSVNHVTTGQPDSHQVYMGVIMPTQNCERANASRPANWQYDCSTWCKSFVFYNKTAVSTPQLPAICEKYLGRQARPQPQPTQSCSANDYNCQCAAVASISSNVALVGWVPKPSQAVKVILKVLDRFVKNPWLKGLGSVGWGDVCDRLLVQHVNETLAYIINQYNQAVTTYNRLHNQWQRSGGKLNASQVNQMYQAVDQERYWQAMGYYLRAAYEEARTPFDPTVESINFPTWCYDRPQANWKQP
jgi:hypothetical protein